MGKRAYINPVPGFGEKDQRAFIEKHVGPVDEWYVESRSVSRADFIRHLRRGDVAVVARIGCLASATLRMDRRMTDLAEARGDILAQGATVVSGENLKTWVQMKDAAKAFFRWTKNLKNASANAHKYTDAQLRDLLIISVNKKLGNWDKRRAKIKRKGIPMCGRTWFIEKLPIIASRRGVEI